MIVPFDNNAIIQEIFRVVQAFFDFAFYFPFKIQFFMFPFSFGHLIYAGLIISVSISILRKFVHGGFDRSTSGKVG